MTALPFSAAALPQQQPQRRKQQVSGVLECLVTKFKIWSARLLGWGASTTAAERGGVETPEAPLALAGHATAIAPPETSREDKDMNDHDVCSTAILRLERSMDAVCRVSGNRHDHDHNHTFNDTDENGESCTS